MIHALAIYCGSSAGADPAFAKAADDLGRALAQRNCAVIYGGSHAGLMGVVADAALAEGGRVVGVIPQSLVGRELAHQGLSTLEIVDSMHARKARMCELADGFVALPGGIGTLDETFEIITWRHLGLHDKPIVLIDNNGYWRPFVALIDHVIATGFAKPAIRGLYQVVDRVEDVLPAIAAAPKPALADAAERL